MKNKLSLIIASILLSSSLFGQIKDVQASITKTSAAGSVTVFLKAATAHTGRVSGLTVSLAIPTSVGTRPTVTVDNSLDPSIVYTIQNSADEIISGVSHYVFNLLGTGDVNPTGQVMNFAAGVSTPIVKASFSGSTGISALVKMVSLPDGGSDPNPNAFFGFSLDGADIADDTNLFFSVPTFSTAINNIGNTGYLGTSFSQTTELVPVPVKFLGFTAIKKDNDALLSWSVENESGLTDRYEVERSLNGTDFAKVYTVAPKNNGSSSNIYNLTDANLTAIRSTGVIYYRIKQIDKDGKAAYTEIRSVRLEGKGIVIGVYPNPVRDVANVSLDLTDAADVVILVTDAAGKEVQKINMQAVKGLNTKKINMAGYASGTYLFKVATGTDVKSISVIKAQ